jgi:hypothetical protein
LPRLFPEPRCPLLLLDDVEYYDKGLARLLGLLDAKGLGAAPTKLPVVLFGREDRGSGDLLKTERERHGSVQHKRFRCATSPR